MSIKKTSRSVFVSGDGTQTRMEDAVIYATTRSEAKALPTANLLQGSVLFIIREAKMYMLDTDGGVWYNTATGVSLGEEA